MAGPKSRLLKTWGSAIPLPQHSFSLFPGPAGTVIAGTRQTACRRGPQQTGQLPLCMVHPMAQVRAERHATSEIVMPLYQPVHILDPAESHTQLPARSPPHAITAVARLAAGMRRLALDWRHRRFQFPAQTLRFLFQNVRPLFAQQQIPVSCPASAGKVRLYYKNLAWSISRHAQF